MKPGRCKVVYNVFLMPLTRAQNTTAAAAKWQTGQGLAPFVTQGNVIIVNMLLTSAAESLISLADLSVDEALALIRPYFDRDFYLGRYQDIRPEQVDPAEHYFVYGWREGRDPSPWFSTDRYLAANPDVAEGALDPFLHYIVCGKNERRRVWAADSTGPVELTVDPAAQFVTDDSLRDLIDYPPRALQPPTSRFNARNMSIHWLIPDFSIGSGGHMTIFRMVRWLELFGHECTIWINSPSLHQTVAAASEDILKHFQVVRARVALADQGFDEATGDIVIATGWQTVARVRHATQFRERFYFVQDYESSFYPTGSHFLAAEWTYTQGMAAICASPWLVHVLRERHGCWSRHFELAYDRDIYNQTPGPKGQRQGAPRIAVYARRNTARRAVELALLALEHLARQGISFHADLFGEELQAVKAPFPCTIHDILDAEALAELYRSADLGLCFSATNYSLIPQEMMACGLPVIELNCESTRTIFPDEIITRTGPHPLVIAEDLNALLSNATRCADQARAATKWVSRLSWETSARQVEAALIERLHLSVPTKAARVRKTSAGGRVEHSAGGSHTPLKASICIPTYNGGDLLVSIVKMLRSQRASWPFEIVIVDSDSSDGSIERIAEIQRVDVNLAVEVRVRTIPTVEFQHGRTRNLCVQSSRGEFVAFLTQDAMPTSELWLYDLVTMLERFPNAAGVFGRHIPYHDASPFVRRDITSHFEGLFKLPLVLSRETPMSAWRGSEEGWRQVLHYFSDNNACLRRTAWDRIPYPEIAYGEDQAWAHRAIQQGWEKVYAPTAAVFHSHNYSLNEIAERAETEAVFFANEFGYNLYDFSRNFADQLYDIQARDLHWAELHHISATDIDNRLLEDKAQLYGRAKGMQSVLMSRSSWAS